MKKRFELVMLVLAVFLCSCTQQIAPTASDGTSPQTKTVGYILIPNPLPLPDSIELAENPNYEFGNEWEYLYRVVYYNVPWEVCELADDDGFSLNLDGDDLNPFGPEPEMVMVAFIKHYEIKKEDFTYAVQRIYNWCIGNGFDDIYAEGNELPNADIIYTFDNEIINAYYRRENPVVPEPGTYTTYESYEEYLKVNQ